MTNLAPLYLALDTNSARLALASEKLIFFILTNFCTVVNLGTIIIKNIYSNNLQIRRGGVLVYNLLAPFLQPPIPVNIGIQRISSNP